MTALDANVIVRYLVADVPDQAEAARSLIEQLTPDNPGFVCREVVIETAWVLERSYRFPRKRIAEALMDLAASDSLLVENAEDVVAAAHRYRQGGVGFADLMILAASEKANALPLYTFDRRLGRVRGVVLVGGGVA